MSKSASKTNDHLHRQLIKLGDMMGDGLHLEPDGKWIATEYRSVARALGLIPKRENNARFIDEQMTKRVESVACPKCGGGLRQTRSGSMRAKCTHCGSKLQLLKRKKP